MRGTLVLLMTLLVGVTAGAAEAAPKVTHRVTMEQMKFSPATLNVKVGDTIEWVNTDIVPHNVTSPAAKIQSGTIKPGATWKWTATKAGSFPYRCSFHPTMRGNLKVSASGTSKP